MMSLSDVAFLLLSIASLSACGGPSAIWGILTDVDAANTSSDTSRPTEGGQTATSQSTGSLTEALSATGSQTESSSLSSTAASTSTGASGSTSEIDTGESSANGSTGRPLDCTTLDETQCLASNCMAFVARPFFTDEAMWCLQPPLFLACAAQATCDDVITTACNGSTKYQFKNSCLPEGFTICAAPPDAGMDGYPDCP